MMRPHATNRRSCAPTFLTSFAMRLTTGSREVVVAMPDGSGLMPIKS